MKGATSIRQVEVLQVLYFNPRTREGCDGRRSSPGSRSGLISIHAPVKGATDLLHRDPHQEGISIHAPVKGATSLDTWLLRGQRISIHAPVKGATSDLQKEYNELKISIHAPVKGATRTC